MSESAIDKLCREAREAVDAVVVERDQLRQQVERLLGEIDNLAAYLRCRPGDPVDRLYQAADQVRKELEGR
jgi:hypothetical protein